MPSKSAVIVLALAALVTATALALVSSPGALDGDIVETGTTSQLPARGLHITGAAVASPGGQLELAGSGLPPDLPVVVVPCGSAALDRGSATACDYRHAQRTTTDGAGLVTFAFRAVRHLSVDDQTIDCAITSCAITVLALTEPTTELHREDLIFAANDESPFEVTATPDTGLRHLSTIAVGGNWEAATIELCIADNCDSGSSVQARRSPVDFLVPAAVVTPEGVVRTCGTGACFLRVTTDQGSIERPLAFEDGSAPPFAAVVDAGADATLTLSALLGTWYRAELCEVAFLAEPGTETQCRPVGEDAVWGPATSVVMAISVPEFCVELCELRVTSGAGDAFASLVEVPVSTLQDALVLGARSDVAPLVGGSAAFSVEGAGIIDVALCRSGADSVSDSTCSAARRVTATADLQIPVPHGASISIDGVDVSCNAIDSLCAIVAETDGGVTEVAIKAEAAKPDLAADLATDEQGLWVTATPTPLVLQRCANTAANRCDPPVLLDASEDLLLTDLFDLDACECTIRVGAVDGSLASVSTADTAL